MNITTEKLNKKIYIIFILIASFIVASGWLIDFDIKGHYFGIFVLKGDGRKLIKVQDDLLLGEDDQLLVGFSLALLHNLLMSPPTQTTQTEPRLALDWDEKLGNGWVRSVFADQTEMHFYFSRLISDSGTEKHGLFVGGSLPPAAMELNSPLISSDSGISFFDGHRNWHIWCNSNEVIVPRDDPKSGVQTAAWHYLGSRIETNSSEHVVLSSSHDLLLAGTPLRIDRQASFRAGIHSFDLSIHITNTGARPVSYIYAYADEPWLGNYGSSEGEIGWLKEGLVPNEGLIDTVKDQYAGMINLKYGLANIIVWAPTSPPTLAGFSNAIGRISPGMPLSKNERAINMQWGHTIKPGETHKINLTIGMAKMTNGIPSPYNLVTKLN